MFDDYKYKNSDTRVSIRFEQKHDEPMFPWEIAYFLKSLNTIYYKNELLNSISSCINSGISPNDIYILDKSLPLYQQYANLNLLDESQLSGIWYHIGSPYPLQPNLSAYKHNLLLNVFNAINSFLHSRGVRPLQISGLNGAYKIFKNSGLEDAEEHILELALARSELRADNAHRRGDAFTPVTWDDLRGGLKKYQKQKEILLSDVQYLEGLTDEERIELLKEKSSIGKRRAALTLAFFKNFNETMRPLVCAKVSDGVFRVLGRTLVNKKEKNGLELKEIKKNSPLGAIFEGGAAIYKTIQAEKRATELHELQKEKIKLEIAQEREKLEAAKYQHLAARIEVSAKLERLAQTSDIRAVDNLNIPFIKAHVEKAYAIQSSHSDLLLMKQGMILDPDSIKVIDVRV